MAVTTAAPSPPAAKGNIAWKYAGMVIDLVHMPLVLGMVTLGASVWSGPVYAGVITAVVVLQVALLGCPVMYLTGWMKRRHDPDHQIQWSFTAWLYQKYGRAVGVAVFAFFMALAVLLRWLMF